MTDDALMKQLHAAGAHAERNGRRHEVGPRMFAGMRPNDLNLDYGVNNICWANKPPGLRYPVLE